MNNVCVDAGRLCSRKVWSSGNGATPSARPEPAAGRGDRLDEVHAAVRVQPRRRVGAQQVGAARAAVSPLAAAASRWSPSSVARVRVPVRWARAGRARRHEAAPAPRRRRGAARATRVIGRRGLSNAIVALGPRHQLSRSDRGASRGLAARRRTSGRPGRRRPTSRPPDARPRRPARRRRTARGTTPARCRPWCRSGPGSARRTPAVAASQPGPLPALRTSRSRLVGVTGGANTQARAMVPSAAAYWQPNSCATSSTPSATSTVSPFFHDVDESAGAVQRRLDLAVVDRLAERPARDHRRRWCRRPPAAWS